MTISYLHLYLIIDEYDEHVACLNECMFASTMYMKGILVCIMFKLFISALYAYSCSWGYFPIYLVLVASSSSVRGSGTLHSLVWRSELN